MLIQALTPIYSSFGLHFNFTSKQTLKIQFSSSNHQTLFKIYQTLLSRDYCFSQLILFCLMASGSSKGFDFASDDILCSYEDYANQEQSNPTHSDPAIATNSAKEFNKSRMARTDNNEEVIVMAVERSVKKHTDNVMRFLEGLSSRLSQLELYCYNLDKSIGEMRSDLTQDHVESEAKLKFLEKHLQEVHRSVQILRDKQELADTQKELAKLQIARKESSSSHDSKNDTPATRKNETPVDSHSHGQQLALVPAPSQQPPPMTQPQQHAYYMSPGPTAVQYSQAQLPPQVQSVPQYQQQWTSQVQPQPSMQPGSVASKPSPPQVYPQYLPSKPPVNPSPESHPISMPMQSMQMTYSTIPPPGSNQPVAYSYGSPVRTAQPQPPPPQQPTQQPKTGFGLPSGDGYPPNSYVVYDNGSGRVQHPSQGGNIYPSGQQQSGGGGGGGGGVMSRPPQQFMRNHPYGEVIDKLVSMGYRGDHVMSVIQRMDETGQTVDFNSVLDRLNGHSSGRGWSG